MSWDTQRQERTFLVVRVSDYKHKKEKTGDNRAVTFRNMSNEGSKKKKQEAAKVDSYVSKVVKVQ